METTQVKAENHIPNIVVTFNYRFSIHIMHSILYSYNHDMNKIQSLTNTNIVTINNTKTIYTQF